MTIKRKRKKNKIIYFKQATNLVFINKFQNHTFSTNLIIEVLLATNLKHSTYVKYFLSRFLNDWKLLDKLLTYKQLALCKW